MVSCGMKIQCLNLLIRLLAVPACFGYPALVFTTNDVQRHGIIVKQPGHGNFSAALREIAAHPKSKLPDWIGTLPVLIIENASKQPVARLSVRYDLQFSDRPMVRWVHTLIMAEKGLVGGLGPGQSVFVFSGVIHVGPGYAKAPDEQTIISAVPSIPGKSRIYFARFDHLRRWPHLGPRSEWRVGSVSCSAGCSQRHACRTPPTSC